MHLDLAIRSRRTCKTFTGEPVPRPILDELVASAVLAPNHRLTQPWRFGVADRAAVAALVAFVQQPPVCAAVEARKLGAICERLARCGAVVQVTCQRSDDAERARDDRDATAAAVQNLLLAATARGLGSFWSTSPLMVHPEVQRWFGADPAGEAHVATIWLGWPAEPVAVPARKPPVVRWVATP
jgi:nitroreductase